MADKKILITGAKGFVGKNLAAELSRTPDEYELLCADIDTSAETLNGYFKECDFVVHLAGVNRPKDEREFAEGNADFTAFVLDSLARSKNTVPVVITSSVQSLLDNPYGKSKHAAEQAVLKYGRYNDVPVYVFRLPNVFGKWGKPNYNSAVATFCYNTARGLPITVNDPNADMMLVYIDDALELIKACIAGKVEPNADGYCDVPVIHKAKLGYIADKIQEFHLIKDTFVMPPLGSALDKALYSTYLSYLEPDAFSYPLTKHGDERGLFAEMFKTDGNGQFSVSTTKPGITRGNHWHHTKVEKFIVVSGEAAIKFRSIDSGETVAYNVTGNEPTVVDIPPGYTHSITNTSKTETLVTIIWANEQFDPERPDTFFSEV